MPGLQSMRASHARSAVLRKQRSAVPARRCFPSNARDACSAGRRGHARRSMQNGASHATLGGMVSRVCRRCIGHVGQSDAVQCGSGPVPTGPQRAHPVTGPPYPSRAGTGGGCNESHQASSRSGTSARFTLLRAAGMAYRLLSMAKRLKESQKTLATPGTCEATTGV